MDRDRACMGNKISERFLKDLAYGRMWEDDGLQLESLHAFFDSDPGYDDQLGGRISQEVGADDRFVFRQNQLADAVALLVFSDKAAGERCRACLRPAVPLRSCQRLRFRDWYRQRPEWPCSSCCGSCLKYDRQPLLLR